MAREWELHDGAAQVGPLAEDHVLRMIAAGIPETTLIRPAGSEKWKSLRAHAPFAMALESRASTLAVVAPPPSPAVPPPAPSTAQSATVVARVVAYVQGPSQYQVSARVLPRWALWVLGGSTIAVTALVVHPLVVAAKRGSIAEARDVPELRKRIDDVPGATADSEAEERSRRDARAAYERDRDLVRKARPKTEDDITKLLGRKPDAIIEGPGMTMLQWFYETRPIGRDVIQVSVEHGKITMMNL